MALNSVGTESYIQQLTTVVAGTWTDLVPQSEIWKNKRITSIKIQNTGAADMTCSLKFMTCLRNCTDVPPEYAEAELISDAKISGTTRRTGAGKPPGTNTINFSHPMSPSVEGQGVGGFDSATFEDFNGLTYTGEKEISFFNDYTTMNDWTKVQFKSDVATGFIVSVILQEPQNLRILTKGGGTSLGATA